MTPLDASIVRRKLQRIRMNVDTLARATANVSETEYRDDELLRRAVERLLQESIDAAVDVNNYLLRAAGRGSAEDYYSSFIALGKAGILGERLASELAPSTGLRNRIVHEYEELDDAQILRAANEAPERLREYVVAIERYLTAERL